MSIVTAAEFSRLAGVSKPAVTKAVAAGRVVRSGTGIDTENPVNAMYLAGSHQGANGRAVAPVVPEKKSPRVVDTVPGELGGDRLRRLDRMARAKAPDTELTTAVFKAQAERDRKKEAGSGDDDLSPAEKAERAKLARDIAELMADTADLDRQKKVAEIALKKAMEARHTFKLAVDKKNVISRDEFRRVAEGWNSQLSQTVMRVPRRVVSRLWAMAKAGDDARSGEAYLEKALSEAVTRALSGVAKVSN